MPSRVDFSAELILVCNSLDAGGIERVVSTLANEWTRRGRKVCVVTLHDRQRFYALDPAIHHVDIDRAGLTRLGEWVRWLAALVQKLNLQKVRLFRFIGRCLFRLCWKTLNRIYYRILFVYESIALRKAFFYRSASIFALPSRVEGTPNALLEAMNHGLPVVVSDGAPGPLELVNDDETGLVVGVNDVAALAAARERVTEYDLPRALVTWESVVGLT